MRQSMCIVLGCLAWIGLALTPPVQAALVTLQPDGSYRIDMTPTEAQSINPHVLNRVIQTYIASRVAESKREEQASRKDRYDRLSASAQAQIDAILNRVPAR